MVQVDVCCGPIVARRVVSAHALRNWALNVRSWPSRAGGHKVCEVVGDADQLARLMTPDEDLRTKPLSIREKDEMVTFAVTAQRYRG